MKTEARRSRLVSCFCCAVLLTVGLGGCSARCRIAAGALESAPWGGGYPGGEPDVGKLFRLTGAYFANPEHSFMRLVDSEENLVPLPGLDYCLEIHRRCHAYFSALSNSSESGQYLFVDALVTYKSSRSQPNCPLGTVSLERVASARPLTQAEYRKVFGAFVGVE